MEIWEAKLVLCTDENDNWKTFFKFEKAKGRYSKQKSVYYEQNGVEHCINDADTLVYAVGYRSNNSLVSQLEDAGIKVYVTGDAGGVATLKEAISSGYEVARKI